MIGQSIQCEVCKIKRDPSINHWFELRQTVGGAPYIVEWTEEAENPHTKHLCGEKCVHTIMDRYLSSLREKAREKEMVAA